MLRNLFGKRQSTGNIDWIELSNVNEITRLIESSNEHPVLVFKHSIRCGTSAMALNRLHRNWVAEEMSTVKPYFVDVIQHRDVSDNISQTFGVIHQSPQILIIVNGNCIYDDSHMAISYDTVQSVLADNTSV